MTHGKQTRQANARAGFNLIEAAIVLGIVGLIVGGIWAAASSAYENMRQQTASKQLLSLVGNIRNYYQNANIDWGTLATPAANATFVELTEAQQDRVLAALEYDFPGRSTTAVDVPDYLDWSGLYDVG